MAEVGGSHTDGSATNLDSTRTGPGTSKESCKEGALKRPAEGLDDVSVKKRRSAEEQASTSKGRNVAMKKMLKKEKAKKKAEKTEGDNINRLMELRENLLVKLKNLEGREMELNDRAEEKMMAKEEQLKKALLDIEKSLQSRGCVDDEEIDGEEEEKEEDKMKTMRFKIEDWPCLETHVQDFVIGRLRQELGTSLTVEDLLQMIHIVKSLDPSIGLPTEDGRVLERLLCSVNYVIREEVKKHRFGYLFGNLTEYPQVDPNWKPDEELEAKLKEREGSPLHTLNHDDFVNRVSGGCVSAEERMEEDGEYINLDDEEEDDRNKEADEDELSEQIEETEEEEKEDEDIVLLKHLNIHLGLKTIKKEKIDTVVEVSEENTIEKERITEKSDRPDSRDGKELEEGGTSTNSPTLDRDERLNELETIDNNMNEANEMNEKTDDNINKDNAVPKEETAAVDTADTIVLTDDEDSKEVMKMPKNEVIEMMEDGIQPPKQPPMTPEEASRSKMREIQLWVNKGEEWSKLLHVPEVLSVDSESEKEYDEDDDIKCIYDDFDWDSVSHSGLNLRLNQQQEDQNEGQGEDEDIEIIQLD